ncbi:hypothetical protein STEG23_029227 [Scotinomys teguina]
MRRGERSQPTMRKKRCRSYWQQNVLALTADSMLYKLDKQDTKIGVSPIPAALPPTVMGCDLKSDTISNIELKLCECVCFTSHNKINVLMSEDGLMLVLAAAYSTSEDHLLRNRRALSKDKGKPSSLISILGSGAIPECVIDPPPTLDESESQCEGNDVSLVQCD